jgi:rSAM/selenodomain-associated transferase 1
MLASRQHDRAVVAVVIPALNEEGAIAPLVRAVRGHPALAALPLSRVIVVDNGSTDRTAEVARAAGAEVVSEPRRGYGWACLAGVRAAEGADIVLLMDGDGSDDLDGAASVARVVSRGEADLAVGSRVRGRCEPGALTPQQRAGNRVGSLVLRMAYGLEVSDLGPTRAIHRDALQRLDMREMGYGWSTEMLAKAARAGLRVREVAVDYHRRAAGKSKVAGTLRGTLKASAHILRTLARYRRWSSPTDPRAPRRALFIVARLPQAGATKTRLGRSIGHEAAAQLYAAFLRDLGERYGAAARRDGYDLYWYCALPQGRDLADFAAVVPPGGALLQQGDGPFGRRLWEGFRELAGRGYERIVVLGSDSPHVPARAVAAAFRALDTHGVVVGPAQDGGYYLLGQRAPLFDCFTGIEMSTPRVCAETVDYVRAAGRSLTLLSKTFDVDEAADLEALRAALAGAPSWQADPCPATAAALIEIAYRVPPAGHPAGAGAPAEGDADVA